MNDVDLEQSGREFNLDKIKGALVNFVVPLVSVGLMLVMVLTMILPSLRTLPELRIELNEKKTLSSVLETKVSTLNKLIDFKDIVAENSLLIDRVVASEPAPLALQDQIYQIATSAGLAVTKLSYSAGATGDTTEGIYNSVAVSVGSEGVYPQLITFMELVENAARFLSVEGLRYSTSDRDGNVTLVIDLSIESPYMEIESKAVTDEPIGLNIASDEFVAFMNIVKEMQYYAFSADSPVVPADIISPEPEETPEVPAEITEPAEAPVAP